MSSLTPDDITFLSFWGYLAVEAPTWGGASKTELRLIVTHEHVNQKLPMPHKPAHASLAPL